MSAGWVAGSVRARALARRRLGSAAARRLARSPSLAAALRLLADSPYGRMVRPGQSLAQAQRAVAAVVLWDLRVLAGWLPRGGVGLMRALAGGFEIANTDELLAQMAGTPAEEPFELGALATAWPRLRAQASPRGVREVLAASAWADPGGGTPREIRAGMRARWAARLAGLGPPAVPWAAGAVALLVAGERFAAGAQPSAAVGAVAASLLGTGQASAASLDDFARRLPVRARWALAGVGRSPDLWRGEAAWWARVERDGERLLRGADTGRAPVLGSAAVLTADAWRVRAALAIAAGGGEPMEDYDAVA